MANERVGDMTLEELKALIRETVEELQKSGDTLSVAEIVENVRRHRWTPHRDHHQILNFCAKIVTAEYAELHR